MRKILLLSLVLIFTITQLAFGAISYTKDYTSANDGETYGGQDIGNFQDDVSEQAATLTGNNAFTGANTYAGSSTFNGTVVGIDVNQKHYRKGFTIKKGTTPDEDIVVQSGVMDIAATNITAVADSSNLNVGTETFLAGSTGTSQHIYVYMFSDSGIAGYKLSTEAPDLSFSDDTTAEFPLRYQKYGGVYYRCVGSVFQDAAGDLTFGHSGSEGLFVSQFDASNCMIMNGLGTGSDQTINTIWTPKYVQIIYGDQDTSPAAGESVSTFRTTQKMLDTDWFGTQLNAIATSWQSITSAGSINAITAQATGTAGSFTIDAMTDNKLFYVIAYTDEGF